MEILLFLYFAIAIGFLLYFMNKRLLSPTTIFLVSQVLFVLGLIQFLNFDHATDKKIIWVYIVAVLSFGFGSVLGSGFFYYPKRNFIFVEEPFMRFQQQRVSILIGISILLFAYFCYMTRFSTFSIMIDSIMGKDMGNITDDRILSYSVPGTAYIYMFRVTLFPITVVSILNKEYGYSKYAKAFLVVIMILFSLATGQRAGFVMVVFMWMISYLVRILYQKNDQLDQSKKKLKRNLLISVIVFITVFSFMSLVNGRVSENVFSELINRFLSDNQRTAYASFRYIFSHDVTWGRNWYEELINTIYPGDRYLPLSKVINKIMYGTTRGTAPPCLWGSVFYNFSWGGIVVFALVYGVFLQYMEYRFYSRQINTIRCCIYSYIFISLGMLVAGGPFQLVNNGFVPSIILAYVLHVDRFAKRVDRHPGYQRQ